MEISAEIKLTPKQVADALWNMGSDEQAEMLKHLYDIAGGNHKLMMQGMGLRDDCIARGDESLEAFHTLFASAFKYAGSHY
jgi:hypothetical protein